MAEPDDALSKFLSTTNGSVFCCNIYDISILFQIIFSLGKEDSLPNENVEILKATIAIVYRHSLINFSSLFFLFEIQIILLIL